MTTLQTPTPAAPKVRKIPASHIHCDTREYEMTYGKLPRGTGTWAFQIGRDTDPDHIFWAPLSSYPVARRAATAEAQRQGVYSIKTLT